MKRTVSGLFAVVVAASVTSGAAVVAASSVIAGVANRAGRVAIAGSRQGTQGPTTLRILAYNIHHGAGNDEVLDLERIAELIRSLDPDLVALQEIDNRTERTGGVAQAARLGQLTGMGSAFGKFMDYQGGEYGMAVLSRLDYEKPTNHVLPAGPEPR